MKDEAERRVLLDLLIEALQLELEDIFLDSLDDKVQEDFEDLSDLKDLNELDFDIKWNVYIETD